MHLFSSRRECKAHKLRERASERGRRQVLLLSVIGSHLSSLPPPPSFEYNFRFRVKSREKHFRSLESSRSSNSKGGRGCERSHAITLRQFLTAQVGQGRSRGSSLPISVSLLAPLPCSLSPKLALELRRRGRGRGCWCGSRAPALRCPARP